MQRSVLAKRAWVLLFIGITVFYLWGLGLIPLIGPDEPRYAEVAREMLVRRDLITPTLGGHPWFEKPALLYWLMMWMQKDPQSAVWQPLHLFTGLERALPVRLRKIKSLTPTWGV